MGHLHGSRRDRHENDPLIGRLRPRRTLTCLPLGAALRPGACPRPRPPRDSGHEWRPGPREEARTEPENSVSRAAEHARQPRFGAARAGHPADPVPARTSPTAPRQLNADKGYDYDHLRRWLRKRGIRHRIARRGIEFSGRLERRRWVIEGTMSWLTGYRRLNHRSAHPPQLLGLSWPRRSPLLLQKGLIRLTT
ncbi:hypothetical protein E6W17_41755 [Streptomyces sp. A1547]|nr:hypothetical protein E6W17_41755 [Streptomyces sp. A1547]